MKITNIFIYNNLYTIWDRSVWIFIDVKFDSIFYRYPDQWRFDLITSYCHACGQCCNVYMYVNIYWTRRNTSLTRISRKNYCTSRGKINLWDNTNSYQTSKSIYTCTVMNMEEENAVYMYICLWFSSFFLRNTRLYH